VAEICVLQKKGTLEKIVCGVYKTPEARSSEVNCVRGSEKDTHHQIMEFGRVLSGKSMRKWIR